MADDDKTRVTEVIFTSEELGQRGATVVVFDPRREPKTEPDREGPSITEPSASPGLEPTVVHRRRAATPPLPDGPTARRSLPEEPGPGAPPANEAVTRLQRPLRPPATPLPVRPAVVSDDARHTAERSTPAIDANPSLLRRSLAGLTTFERKIVVGAVLFVVAAMLLSYLVGFSLGLG